MSANNKDKILKFENFINDTLKVDLANVLEQRDVVFQKITEHVQLKDMIEQLLENKLTEQPLKTQVDLGCNFYVQAQVPDPSRIYVNIGLGFYVQFQLSEAVTYLNKRIAALNELGNRLSGEAAKIKAHIKLVLEGLREMQNINAEEMKPHVDMW